MKNNMIVYNVDSAVNQFQNKTSGKEELQVCIESDVFLSHNLNVYISSSFCDEDRIFVKNNKVDAYFKGKDNTASWCGGTPPPVLYSSACKIIGMLYQLEGEYYISNISEFYYRDPNLKLLKIF